MKSVLGIIGGSGLYDLPLKDARWVAVETPWGPPSDELYCGTSAGLDVVFLPRHGRGHVHSPTGINYRANIHALKKLGVTDLVSLSAVGSLQEELHPGLFVLVDQFIDRTFAREKSFFGNGCVAHVPLAHPVSPLLQRRAGEALSAAGVPHVTGGTYVVMEGPQFSTLAESRLYRSWGAQVIGMTNMPEAKLAREAEMCYATCAMVTDYDCWHEKHGAVDVAQVLAVMQRNGESARKFVSALIELLPRQHEACPIGSDRALDGAVMTRKDLRDPALVAKLQVVAGRVL
jgi:5'-methylthioadenosine phosphorylase